MSFTPYRINPELDLELVRDVPVPPDAVFAAWTDPESLKQWFAPPAVLHRGVRDRPAPRRRWGSTTAGAPSSTSWWSTSRRPVEPSGGPGPDSPPAGAGPGHVGAALPVTPTALQGR